MTKIKRRIFIITNPIYYSEICLTIKIVLDASVLIDFDTDRVDLNNIFIKFVNDSKNYEIIISQVNFDEIENRFHSEMKRKLLNINNFIVKPLDEPKFEKFSRYIQNDLNVIISKADRVVLFLGIQENANFISTSDTGLYEKIREYRHKKGINTNGQISPITTVGMLNIIFKAGIIDSSLFFDKSLALFKFKEIDNYFSQMVTRDLKEEGEKRQEIVQNHIKNLKGRFQFYKNPLVDEYKNLKSKGLIKA